MLQLCLDSPLPVIWYPTVMLAKENAKINRKLLSCFGDETCGQSNTTSYYV
jgi:hypothetical protein